MKKLSILSILAFILIILSMFMIEGCKHESDEDDQAQGTDKVLYDLATSSANFTWYKNSDALLDRSPLSGHQEPYLRVRYNSVASAELDSTGKVKQGIIFGEGALVVKELYETTSKLGTYAIMYKNSGMAEADETGWVWGYLFADGKVRVAASEKGASCRNCHLQAGNIDLTMMNVSHP
ncbi:MAG: cytochrome P460 family protein [Bacteroidetes bacterium]|nr:cytochrome P460 family protein [Bacteroidota bacterium]